MKKPTCSDLAAKTQLTHVPVFLHYARACHTTPGSFGERAQSHSERSGSCIFTAHFLHELAVQSLTNLSPAARDLHANNHERHPPLPRRQRAGERARKES